MQKLMLLFTIQCVKPIIDSELLSLIQLQVVQVGSLHTH